MLTDERRLRIIYQTDRQTDRQTDSVSLPIFHTVFTEATRGGMEEEKSLHAAPGGFLRESERGIFCCRIRRQEG